MLLEWSCLHLIQTHLNNSVSDNAAHAAVGFLSGGLHGTQCVARHWRNFFLTAPQCRGNTGMPGYAHGTRTEGRAARICKSFEEGPQGLGLSGHWTEGHNKWDSLQLLSHLPHAEIIANRRTGQVASTRRRWWVRQWSPFLRCSSSSGSGLGS